MPNTPIIKRKDFGISVAVFEWNKDGKDSYSAVLQRSYKKKDSEEYVNETINMHIEDLLRMAELLKSSYRFYTNYMMKKIENKKNGI